MIGSLRPRTSPYCSKPLLFGTGTLSNRSGMAANLLITGVAEGVTSDNIPKKRRFRNTDNAYHCQITINYDSPESWGHHPDAAPSESLLQLLSSFLTGDGSNDDIRATFTNSSTIDTDALWIPSWGTSTGITRNDPPASGMAGFLSRATALVIRRLGDGLPNKDILQMQISSVGILSVDWIRVAAVLGGIAVLQVVVSVIAGLAMMGTLDVEDDLPCIDGCLADDRFPRGLEEEGGVAGKPWMVQGRGGDGEFWFKFEGLRERKF